MSEGYTPFPEEKLPADLPTIIIYGVDKSLYIPKRYETELKRVIPEKKIQMPPTEQKLAPKSIYIPAPPSIEITPGKEKSKFPWFLVIAGIVILFILLKEG